MMCVGHYENKTFKYEKSVGKKNVHLAYLASN